MMRARCKHLGNPTGEAVLATARGCLSEQWKTAVYECAIHYRCTVIAEQRNKRLKFCKVCADYEQCDTRQPY